MSCILLFLLGLSTEHRCGCLESAAVADAVFATRHQQCSCLQTRCPCAVVHKGMAAPLLDAMPGQIVPRS